MMLITLVAGVVVLVVVLFVLARYASQKIRTKLKKAGVKLSWGRISSSSVSSITVAVEQGPLQCLVVDSISWGPAARSTDSASTSLDSAGTQQANGRTWLPITIKGVHLVLAASGKPSKKAGKPHKAHAKHAARSAAAWPAVSSALAVAKRLLPGIPVQLQDVKVELKALGMQLLLKRAALHWSVNEQQGSLSSVLLLQDFTLSPGRAGEEASQAAQQANLHCPVAQLTFGVGASRGGPLPLSCRQLTLQVGLVKVTGASQLLLQVAAAAQPLLQPVVQQQLRPSGLQQQRPQQQAQASAAGSDACAAGSRQSVRLPAAVIKAVTLLPDKIKVGLAGMKLLPAPASPEMEPLWALPQLTGSIGAITMGTSSCQRPAAVRPGEKLLNVSLAVGPLQFAAAAGSSSDEGESSAPQAASFHIAGITVAADLAKAVDGASTENTGKHGPLRAALLLHQQKQQRQQLTATCRCKIVNQVQLQLHAHQVASFVKAVQLLQLSLQKLQSRRDAAATAAAAAAAAAAVEPSPEEQENLLPRMGSISPTISFPLGSRPETPILGATTPSLGTPQASGPAGWQSPAGQASGGAAAAAVATSSSRPGDPAAGPAGQAPASPLAAAMQQKLSSLRRGAAAQDYVSLVMDATAVTESGVSVEVLDSRAAVATWLSVQQLEGSVSLEWSPSSTAAATASSGSTNSSNSKQQNLAAAPVAVSLGAALKLQQLAVRVAAKDPSAAGCVPSSAVAGSKQSMHQLLLLDVVDVRANSIEQSDSTRASNQGSPVALEVAVAAGQLQVAPNSSCLQPLLHLAEEAYVPAPSATNASTSVHQAYTVAMLSSSSPLPSQAKKTKTNKPKHVLVSAVDVVLRSLAFTYTSDLPVIAGHANAAAAAAAAAKGIQSQLRVALASLQVCLQPAQQQLAASLQQLQLGYQTLGPTGPGLPAQQSVELLQMQGVEFRQYMRTNLQLLKAAAQQVRSDVHIDAAVAGAGMAEAALQQVAGWAQQLQRRHAATEMTAAEQQAAVAAVVAAAVGTSSSCSSPVALAPLESQLSFTTLATAKLLSPVQADFRGLPFKGAAAAAEPGEGLPPVSRSSCAGFVPVVQAPQHKPVLALEARLQDVAVQLSVCEKDALLVQMELVKYSSVLEQAVVEKLHFSINERSVVQIPHLAVHRLPGWLPPGVAAAAAACTSERSSSPVFGSSVEVASAAAAAAPGRGAGHKLWYAGPCELKGSAGSFSAPQQQFDCGASTESVRFFDDGGVQSWQSIDDPIPSASLGSRRPATSKDAGLYQRQAARQQAARERCKVPAAATAAGSVSSLSGSTAAAGSFSFSHSNGSAANGAAVASSAAGVLLSFEVYAERILFSIPHDEAPGRIILVTETWAKAVKQVLTTQVNSIKSSVATVKAAKAALKGVSGGVSSAAKSVQKKAKPAYLELSVHVQQVVFSLEQNPLETWVGLHGPVLQAMAAERHLTEQLLASCSSAQGRISRTGGSTAAAGAAGAAAAGAGAARQVQPAAQGKKQHWQKRRWGSLGRHRHALATAVAAGSVADAAAAVVAGPAGAGLAALAPGGGLALSSLAAGTPALGGAAAGANTHNAAEAEQGLGEAPLTPRGPEAQAAVTDSVVAETGGSGSPALKAAAAAALSRQQFAGGVPANGMLLESSPATAGGPEGDVASDLSDDLDSSDNEEAAILIDPDALAAALPSSTSMLASAGRQGGAAAGIAAGGDALQKQAGAERLAAADGLNEMQQAVLQAHRELFAMYKFHCRPLHAAAEDPYHHSRAVMHVTVARAEAVVLICLPGHAASAAMASEVIERVDPSSQGVPMERFQSISLDVALQDVVAHFGGVEEMAATIGSLGASGLLIRARQLCAPPQTKPMRMAVGLWHHADVPVVVKGTRPPMKMYTDLRAELDDVQGGFCPGLEAPFGQLNIAFKRLTVPNFLNPDGSVPPSTHPGLPWWDMMRYMWRGVASVRVRGLTAVLANTDNPHVGLRDEKLALTAATLSVAVVAGRIDLTTTKMSTFAHTAAPGAGPGDPLLVLPAFHLPFVTVSFGISTKMPGGRSPLFHHAFPVLSAPPGPDAPPQEVVDVFSLMKCEGWSLAIDIAVNSERSHSVGSIVTPGSSRPGGHAAAAAAGLGSGSGGAAGPSGVAAACWHYFQPYNLPHAFIGEFQIKYIIDMVDTLINPTAVVRLSRKLKPFYARDRRPEAAAAAKAVAAVRAQILPMPMLKQQVEISLTADVFRVHHDAQDSEDPSDMVYIALSSVRYMNSFTYTRYRRTQHFSTGSRLKDSMRQFMASLSVEAYDMKIIKPQGDELSAMLSGNAAAHGCMTPAAAVRKAASHHPDQLDRVRQGCGPSGSGGLGLNSPSRGSPVKGSRLGAAAAAQEDDGSDLPGFSQGLIAAAACFLLRQTPADGVAAAAAAQAAAPGVLPVDPPPIPKRPIRMIAQDVKLLCPAELRDTCILMFHHMQKAFGGITFGGPRGPVRISTTKQQQQGSDSSSGSPRSASRPRSDGFDAVNLSRVSPAMSGSGQLHRHGSADMGSAAASLSDGTNAGQASGNSMVSTPFEEELMLQRIRQENRAASAAAAAKRASKQQQQRCDLSRCSSGSAVAAANGNADGAVVGDHAQGAGHAAVAARALKSAARAVTVVAGAEDDSPRSTAQSDDSSHTGTSGNGGGGSPKKQQQQQQSNGGSYEEVLLEYEIEFVQVQVNLVSDNARGSLVLGTNSALLMGHLSPARLERSVSFKMDQVQAHVVCSEINPQQGPLWLQIANGKLSTPPGAESIMRQVLLPFKCQLVTTKQATNSATAAALNSATAGGGGSSISSAQLHIQPQQQQQQQDRQGVRSSSSSGLPPAGFAPSAAQELRLHVPNIAARLDSRQFEVLMDVIQNIAAAPLPTFPPSVRGMWLNPDGTSEDDDNQDVQYALETLQSLRERQRGLEKELAVVLHAHQQCMQLQQHYVQLALQQQGRAAAHQAAGLYPWDDATAGSSHGDIDGSSYAASSLQQQGKGLLGISIAGGRSSAAYLDIKEASIALVIALADAAALAAAAERPQQQQRSGLSVHPSSSANSSSAAAGGSRTGSGSSLVSLARGQSHGAAGQLLDSLVLVAERQTLIWWAQEQLQGALDAITASRTVLRLLRHEAGLMKVRQRDSMGVSLAVDTIDWALSKGSTVIVQGELQGILYQSIRSEDHTGTTKIQLRTATFRDPQQQAAAAAAAAAAEATPSRTGRSSLTSLGSHAHDSSAAAFGSEASSHGAAGGGFGAGGSSSSSLAPIQCSTPKELSGTGPFSSSSSAAAAEEAGTILAPWNPDESWARDELVRIYAIHGALEKRHIVYEHIEVLVHPIRVHLTAALASALQDYFNLKDEDSKLTAGKGAKAEPASTRAGKQTGREDKRRATAPGDLAPPAGQAASASSSGSTTPSSSRSTAAVAASPAGGPATAAAAPRSKPSIFSRRVAAAAAAAAAASPAAASSLTGAAPAPGSALGSAQPQIVVPPLELDTGIHAVEVGKAAAGGFVTPADSPATDTTGSLPAPVLAAAGTEDDASTAEGADAAGSAYAATAAAAADAAFGVGASTPVPPSPGPCMQPMSADAALLMRYGTVMRGRTGRAANAPGTPSSSTAGAAVGPGALSGAGGSTHGGSAGSSANGGAAGPGSASGAAGANAGGVGSSGAGAAGAPQTPAGASAAAGSAAAGPVRSIKFKHVRFNRMHARLTYEGPPLTINGFGLVLDNRVYRNIDGGWKTVLNRYKWDAIRSLAKSATGLQARKLQELQIPNFGSEPADTLELRSSSGFKAGLMSLLKGRKPAGAKLRLNSGEGGLTSEDMEQGGLRDGSNAGGEGGDGQGGSGGGAELGGNTDYMDLMRDALRAKQKQKKMALLLGNVPPPPASSMLL